MNSSDYISTKRKQMTPEQLGSLIERIEKNEYKLVDWYPTMEDAEEISQDPVDNYEFLIWILYSNPDRELTEEEKEVEQTLETILKRTTKYIEPKKAG